MADTFTWPDILTALVAHHDLTADQTGWVMRQVLSGDGTPAQIAGFAMALRSKGETVAEVEGFVDTMYEFAAPLHHPDRAVDIVGTGGDRAHTVNISTMAALVAAAAGVPVLKHGNRAASSKSGAADVLEALGVRLDLTPEQVGSVMDRVGITFCFAPVFHSALRHAAVPRRELGIQTFFNFLGPLANPARPACQAVGVADARMAGIIAGVLARRGVDGFVFRGDDGLDEITTTTSSQVWEIRGGDIVEHRLHPSDVGLPIAAGEDLVGGDTSYNASVVRSLVAGQTGPVRDAVLFNAAAAIVAYDAGSGPLPARLAAAIERGAVAVDTGAAAAKLTAWVAACSEV